jgi:hypothetical protein
MIDLNLVFDGTFAANGTPTGVAITSTAASTNILDMLTARDVGAGDELELHVDVTTAFATLTSLQIAYQTSPDTTSGNFVNILLSPVILLASLVVGAKVFRYKVPPFQLLDTGTPNRYHRLNYTVAGSAETTGTVVSYLTGMGDRNVVFNYPTNYTIGA